MTTAPPIFTDGLQVAIIVRDLDAAIRRYHDEYGVGPWAIFEFNPETIDDMVIDDAPADYAMRLAVAFIGRLQFELIEPLDDRSHASSAEGARPARRRLAFGSIALVIVRASGSVNWGPLTS